MVDKGGCKIGRKKEPKGGCKEGKKKKKLVVRNPGKPIIISKAPAPVKKKKILVVKTTSHSPLSLKERIKLANTTRGDGYVNGYVGLIMNNKLISYANKEGKLSVFYDYTNGYKNMVLHNLSSSRK